jgi:hypothetical protein
MRESRVFLIRIPPWVGAAAMTSEKIALKGRNILIFRRHRTGRRPSAGRKPIQHLQAVPRDRCGPDTEIDPADQMAFYDAGLGSQPPGGAIFLTRAYRWLHNLASQATRLLCGDHPNVEARRPALPIRLQSGCDTVRCLAAVIGLRGVPTRMPDGSPLRRDIATTTHIAGEAGVPARQLAEGQGIFRPASCARRTVPATVPKRRGGPLAIAGRPCRNRVNGMQKSGERYTTVTSLSGVYIYCCNQVEVSLALQS